MIPVARERTQLADSLVKYLSLLGLKRVSKNDDLDDYIARTYGNRNSSDNGGDDEHDEQGGATGEADRQ